MRYDQPGWFTRERLLTFALLAATGIALYLCYLIVSPFFAALAWAMAFAVIAHPLHRRIAARIRNRNVGALLAVGVVVATLAGPGAFVIRQLVTEASSGAQVLQEETKHGRWRTQVHKSPHASRILTFVESNFDVNGLFERISNGLAEVAKRIVSSSAAGLVQLAIAMFALFYIFRDHEAVMRGIRSMLPLSQTEAEAVLARISDTIQATVFGSVTVALVQGTLGGIMLAILGIPGAAVWAVVMFLVAVVPVLGTPVVWFPVAIYLALQGNWVKAVVLVAYGMTVIGLIDNVLYPVLVGHKLRLHPLPVFFSIVGGISAFGASGIVLGPVLLAVTLALFDVWCRRTSAGHSAETPLDLRRAG